LGLSILEVIPENQQRRKREAELFRLHDFGWEKRIKLGMQRFIVNATKESLNSVGLRRAEAILKNKKVIADRYIEENRWNNVKGVGAETWRKIAQQIKESEAANIDTVVTTDIHRLIRMNGTLHGKTGLRKVEFPLNLLTDFDPFKEAVAFKEGTARISISSAPEFRIGDKTYGPYENSTVELPTAAAVLLICKGRAEVVN
jgi:DNA primase catalytic subunit